MLISGKRLSDRTKQKEFAVDYTGAAVIITYSHARIHAGQIMHTHYEQPNVRRNEAITILIQTGDEFTFHIEVLKEAEREAEYRIFEAPTFSDQGTVLQSRNRHRASTDVPKSIITHSPVITDKGTQIEMCYSQNGKFSHLSEYVFPLNSIYLLELTNIAPNRRYLQMSMDFYEVDIRDLIEE